MKKNFNIIVNDEINYYLKDLKKIPVITHEREIEIFTLLKDKTLEPTRKQDLIDEIVRGNLRFVISIAKTYQNQGLEISDLISEGNIGLMKAIDKFNIDAGYKFISYAVWWVRQQIKYALNEYSRTIRIPSNLVQDALKMKKDSELFEKGDNDSLLFGLPTTIDIYREINDEGDPLLDLIPNDNADRPDIIFETDTELKTRIRNVLSCLDAREFAIIEGYFGLSGVEKNLEDLGEEFGCTKERIRQLKDRSLKKLRNNSYDLLKHF